MNNLQKTVSVKWFDFAKTGLIVRKFNGCPIEENENTITFTYNKKIITLDKKDCFIYYL